MWHSRPLARQFPECKKPPLEICSGANSLGALLSCSRGLSLDEKKRPGTPRGVPGRLILFVAVSGTRSEVESRELRKPQLHVSSLLAGLANVNEFALKRLCKCRTVATPLLSRARYVR